MRVKRFLKKLPASLPCLYCGVDSRPVVIFFAWLVGAGILGSLCWLLWAMGTGKFREDPKISQIPLDLEKGDGHGL